MRAPEWQRTAAALAERRAEATVDLLVTALMQDMRGVQVTVLSNEPPDLTDNTPAARYNLIASAFARYPYPGAFFTWSAPQPHGPVFYSRSDRSPSWLPPPEDTPNLFPVAVSHAADVGVRLLTRIALDAKTGRRYSTFDVALGESQCQVVSLLSYEPDPHRPTFIHTVHGDGYRLTVTGESEV